MEKARALGPLLGRAGHLGRERMDVRLSQFEVTPAQTHVLLYLNDRGGQAPQGEVTAFLRVRPSTANGIIDRLEEKGMVARTVSGRDARRRLITLTCRGQEQQALFRETFQTVEDLMLRGFSQEETEQFYSLLERVIQNLEEDRRNEEQTFGPGGSLHGVDCPGGPLQRGGGCL